MKKILLAISMLVAMFTFSKGLNNGIYKTTHIINGTAYEMDMIVRNNDIVSLKFDIKGSNGRSLIFGNKQKMNERLEIENQLISGENIEDLKIFDETSTKKIKELYYNLLEKARLGQTGRFTYED